MDLESEISNLLKNHENYHQNIFTSLASIKNLEQFLNLPELERTKIWPQFLYTSQIEFTKQPAQKLLNHIENLLHNSDLIQSPLNKPKLFYYKGLIQQLISTKSSSSVENNLQKCIKLDPSNINAWNQLGEAYWRRHDLKQSLDCYEHAENCEISEETVNLLGEKSKCETFRNLGSLLRQLPFKTEKERSLALEKSFKITKKALALNLNSGKNWQMLGNAYISLGSEGMQQADKSYKKALELDSNLNFNSDLLFNYAQVFIYFGQFEKAIQNLQMVQILEPTWELAKNKLISVIKYLEKINFLIVHKGKLKNKQLLKYGEKLQNLGAKNLENSGIVVASYEDKFDLTSFTAILMMAEDQFVALKISNLLGFWGLNGPKMSRSFFLRIFAESNFRPEFQLLFH